LTYDISGTPASAGTASFALNIGGQSCTFTVSVAAAQLQYPAGSVFCESGPTAIVDVTNPATGKTWMDRNLGAFQVATNSADPSAFGDLYQWGRRSDGHQCRTSGTTSTLSTTDQPAHGDFILAPQQGPFDTADWRNPQNDNLWQGVNGINNPCPSGYRLPTEAELEAERASWGSNSIAGAFASPLKLPVAGIRLSQNGDINNPGYEGHFWTSTVFEENANRLVVWFNPFLSPESRGDGRSVRCIKD
jgi:hypothetical protein